MARLYFDGDAELIRGKVISMIGFGNQGSAQALNLRDGGFNVIVGNIEDEYASRLGVWVSPCIRYQRLSSVVMLWLWQSQTRFSRRLDEGYCT